MSKYIVAITSEEMGRGNSELGKTIMKAFFSALEAEEVLPDEILLYHGGVLLANEGSDFIEVMQNLKERGVSIKACGTCVSFYQIDDTLRVAETTNMRYILQQLRSYDRVVQP